MFPNDSNDVLDLQGKDIRFAEDTSFEVVNGKKLNFVGDVRVNDVVLGSGEDFVTTAELDTVLESYVLETDLAAFDYVTPAELTAATADMATDSELAAAVAPIANMATDTELSDAITAVKLKTITTYSGTSVTFALVDAYRYLRFTGTSPTVTVPDNAAVAFPVGTVIDGISTVTSMTFAAAGGVTLNKPRTLVTNGPKSGWTLIKVATNEWDLHGDFI